MAGPPSPEPVSEREPVQKCCWNMVWCLGARGHVRCSCLGAELSWGTGLPEWGPWEGGVYLGLRQAGVGPLPLWVLLMVCLGVVREQSSAWSPLLSEVISSGKGGMLRHFVMLGNNSGLLQAA